MERGRPSGRRKLPEEYQVDLVNLLHYWQSKGHSLSATCEHIIKNGGVEWIDKATGKTVAKITEKGILRTRLIEAKNWYHFLKTGLETVKHPRAAEFGVLPIKLGIAIERRGRRTMAILGRPPERTTQLRIGKKVVHRPK
jgi:hypothetical protein